MTWTREIVRARLREAFRVLARMPLDDRDRPPPPRLMSLERKYTRTAVENFAAAVDEVMTHGRQAPPPVRPAAPDPVAIDRAYEAISWLFWLNRTQRRICAAKASRARSARLPQRYGCDRTTINRWHNHALDRIVRKLEDRAVRVREAEEIG